MINFRTVDFAFLWLQIDYSYVQLHYWIRFFLVVHGQTSLFNRLFIIIGFWMTLHVGGWGALETTKAAHIFDATQEDQVLTPASCLSSMQIYDVAYPVTVISSMWIYGCFLDFLRFSPGNLLYRESVIGESNVFVCLQHFCIFFGEISSKTNLI